MSLASAFAERGLRVLVVDLDPQGSTTSWLGASESEKGLVEFSTGGVRVRDLVMNSTAPGVDLIRRARDWCRRRNRAGRGTGLDIVRAFARLPDHWDIVLVDTPPTVGYLSLAPLVASDRVLIPVEAHALSLLGVASVMDSIKRARVHVNRRLELLEIIACRVTPTSHTREARRPASIAVRRRRPGTDGA